MGARGQVLVTYIDSSALVRRLMREGETDLIVDALVSGPMTSVITPLEIMSAITRRARERAIMPEDRDAMIATREDMIARVVLLPLTEEVLADAQGLIAIHALRSLDAIHLGTARLAARHLRRHGQILHFCTADRRQAEAARVLFGAERTAFVPPLH